MHKHKERLIKKAIQSDCGFKVSAIGLNRKGDVIYIASNGVRFKRKHGGIHAEMKVMLKAGPGLHSIIICRTNRTGGNLLPIDPCKNCQKMADKLGVKIYSLTPGESIDE